jgi:hypothetical protein
MGGFGKKISFSIQLSLSLIVFWNSMWGECLLLTSALDDFSGVDGRLIVGIMYGNE